MIKLKATKKELKDHYYHIIGIGYCDAQFLLEGVNPFSYCTDKGGWACDNYDVDGVLISTGYSPIETKNANKDYNVLCEFESQAMEIKLGDYIPWEELKTKTNALLKQFIKQCISQNKNEKAS
jgi:hypothetical protein